MPYTEQEKGKLLENRLEQLFKVCERKSFSVSFDEDNLRVLISNHSFGIIKVPASELRQLCIELIKLENLLWVLELVA